MSYDIQEIKILELFGGIGAIRKAFERAGIPHKVVDYVEIDKYAVKSYNAMFNENFEVQDICEWDKNIEVDLIMHGSPCQDFSVAGLQAGGDLGSGTRSSLMYETVRIVGKLRPKYVIWENVKNVLSKKHKHNFDRYIDTLNTLGYNSYYQVLNAKDYGIPQNRERVFTISVRKDIDRDAFKFPEKQELKLRLKDILEEEVDEKYYLQKYQLENIKNFNFNQNKKRIQQKDYCDTLCARDWKDPKCVQVGTLNMKGHEQIKRVYGVEGIEPTTTTNKGEGLKINVNRIGGIFDTEKSKHQAGSIYDKEGLAPTLDAMQGGWRQPSIVEEKFPGAYGRDFGSKEKIQEEICDTLQAAMGCGGGNVPLVKKEVERTPLKFLNRNQKNIEGDYAFCVDSCNTGGIKEISIIKNK